MATNGYEYDGLIIEGVENGFLICNGCEKYIFTTLKSALKFIEDSFSKE